MGQKLGSLPADFPIKGMLYQPVDSYRHRLLHRGTRYDTDLAFSDSSFTLSAHSPTLIQTTINAGTVNLACVPSLQGQS